MKIVFAVYHDLNTEARSQEMLEIMKLIGSTTLVSYSDYGRSEGCVVVNNRNNKKNLFAFFLNTKKAIDTIRPSVVLLHDNYTSIFIKYIKKRYPDTIVIYDSSELRFKEEGTRSSIKGRIAGFFIRAEEKYINLCDYVIAANKERALLMKDRYSLSAMPFIFDNMHMIDGNYNVYECSRKFQGVFDKNAFYALYAGGISEKRMTYTLAKQIGLLGEKYQLIIVGAKENNGDRKLSQILSEYGISNVQYLGFVTREELKYLMDRVDVTISTFAMDCLNNVNCASGKVYEGLFQGKPLLAGINPPLKNLCDTYKIGVSTVEFGSGLVEIERNYDYYCQNVKEFISDIDYDNRIREFANVLLDAIKQKLT